MKKAFDQTVRDLKREVNKKVLKVPSIEQKVMDATNNEPWGPHGSHLADIAQATRNYHEYQMIMTVIWKRINDTGKNWRHVYKALTVLEYLVAHGSERVIDEIREHAYQISTLSDFQYIDSSGRDQGSNVRKKSQSLVVLANDKERIQEVRQKAATNRDKYRNTSGGGMYKPSSYSGTGGYGDRYEDDRYGSRDEDRNGYGRERESGDDRYGRYGDSYGRDADRYGSNYDERTSRDGYRDDDYRGRSRSVDDHNYSSRSRSSDRDRDRAYEDDGQYSSRGSGAKAEDQSQDGSVAVRRLDRKYSEQNLGAPPSYEEAVGDGRSPVHSERDGETSAAFAPKLSSPPASISHHATTVPSTAAAPAADPSPRAAAPASPPPPPPPPAASEKGTDGFDEFDPRSSFSAAPTTSNGAEMDLLGSLSDSFSNSLAIVPATTASSEADISTNPTSGQTFVATSASSIPNQPFEDPFGDGPFRAIPTTDSVPAQPQITASTSPFTNQSNEAPKLVAQNLEAANNFGFGDAFSATSHAPQGVSNIQLSATSPQYSQQELSTPNQNFDILADILPPSGPSPSIYPQAGFQAQTSQPATQAGFQPQTGQPSSQSGFLAQTGPTASQTGYPAQPGQPSFPSSFPVQPGQPPSMAGFPSQPGQSTPQPGFSSQNGQPTTFSGYPSQMGPVSQAGFPASSGLPTQQSGNFYGSYQPQPGSTASVVHPMSQNATPPPAQHNTANFYQQLGSAAPLASPMQTSQVQSSVPLASQPGLSASTGALAIVPQPAKDKFETKSTVWADTLNRGLVNLNISGSKTNPLSDIGIDFEAINRKEKRMEKPSAVPVTSNVTMGKAMGSGSGIGRAGVGALRTPPPNPMMGSGMGMGLGGGLGTGSGIGGYGVNQPMGMGMGMGMGINMPMNPGLGMNMGQGVQMRPPAGFPPGSNMPGGYNPMMGTGGYGQQPYGSGYR